MVNENKVFGDGGTKDSQISHDVYLFLVNEKKLGEIQMDDRKHTEYHQKKDYLYYKSVFMNSFLLLGIIFVLFLFFLFSCL